MMDTYPDIILTYMKNAIFCVYILIFAFVSGCKKETSIVQTPNIVSHTTTISTAPTSEPVQVSETVKPKEITKNDWLAKLQRQTNRVEYRLRNQNIWKPTEDNLSFMKYDALQTKNTSTAEIIYQSGSTLDVRENSLIIFDEDPGKKKKPEDRVIIKSGQLTGKTKTELWVFTDSGLVQIKALKNATSKIAAAKIVIQKDRSLTINVNQGVAEVIYKKDNQFEKITVAEKSDLNLKASTNLTTETTVDEVKIQELATAKIKPAQTKPADINIDFPKENDLVNDFEITVRGKVSGEGAKLLINGQLTEIASSGDFSKTVSLQAGTNLIVFQIIRSDSSVKFLKRNVRYQPR